MIKTNYTYSLSCSPGPISCQITPSVTDRVSQVFRENKGIIGCALVLSGAIACYRIRGAISSTEVGEYQGPRMFGLRHGKGSLTGLGGSYTGDFYWGKCTGNGSLKTSCGDAYQGQFVNGEAHGEGCQKYANGDCYVGEFVCGEPSGEGIFTYANGQVYKGQLLHGKAHGKGVRTCPRTQYRGSFVAGKWENGVWELGDGRQYQGTFVPGMWKNGVFVEDQLNYYGACESDDGKLYRGTFTGYKFSGIETSRLSSLICIEHVDIDLFSVTSDTPRVPV